MSEASPPDFLVLSIVQFAPVANKVGLSLPISGAPEPILRLECDHPGDRDPSNGKAGRCLHVTGKKLITRKF